MFLKVCQVLSLTLCLCAVEPDSVLADNITTCSNSFFPLSIACPPDLDFNKTEVRCLLACLDSAASFSRLCEIEAAVGSRGFHGDEVNDSLAIDDSQVDCDKNCSQVFIRHFRKYVLCMTSPESYELPPGKDGILSIAMRDEGNRTVKEVLSLRVESSTSSVSIETGSVLLTGSNMVKFAGEPSSRAVLLVSSIHHPNLKASVNLTLSECPPGFFFNNDTSRKVCQCSTSQSRDDRYVGIENCDSFTFNASLRPGHWAGYIEERERKIFVTGFCPREFCSDMKESGGDVELPSSIPADHDLSQWVCRHRNREGVLCARCIANHSVSFTTYRDCHPDKYCHLGWLFYILSQILPVTVLFCFVIAFDINLTSGAVSGVIFYAQVFDNLLILGNGFIEFRQRNDRLLRVLRVILRMFNLRFFTFDAFSFCLYEGAGLLDVIAFDYVTVTYSLILVFLTVKVIVPCFKALKNRCRRPAKNVGDKQLSSKSIIHGLTGFLVLCYSQSTTTSLSILAYANLYGRGGKAYRSLVFYNGELEYFQGKHLYYALPASFFLVVVTVVPPLLLLSYPLCYRVLALCRIQESRFTRLLCKAIPLEKYKPLFDSFQGSYKDEHRYFAGLQFLFRLAIIGSFAVSRQLAIYYVLLEVELVLMLSLYAFAQPHKKTWHNRIQTSIFTLLAVVNACTILSFQRTKEYAKITPLINIVAISTIQVVLAYIPLVYVLVYIVWLAVAAVRKKIKRKRGEREVELSLRDYDSVLDSRYSPYVAKDQEN